MHGVSPDMWCLLSGITCALSAQRAAEETFIPTSGCSSTVPCFVDSRVARLVNSWDVTSQAHSTACRCHTVCTPAGRRRLGFATASSHTQATHSTLRRRGARRSHRPQGKVQAVRRWRCSAAAGRRATAAVSGWCAAGCAARGFRAERRCLLRGRGYSRRTANVSHGCGP